MTTDGKKSLKTDCISAVLTCMTTATSKEEFIPQMEEHGYEVKWEDNRKYVTFTHIETGKSFRDKNLAETYSIELSKEVLEDAFNRNRTVLKERSAITDEGDREHKVLEEPVRKATEEYANQDANHRTSAEKNSLIGGTSGNGSYGEWPVERLDRRIDETAKRTRGITDWGKKLRETFSHCLEQLRAFGFGNRVGGNVLEYETENLATKLEELRVRFAYKEHSIRTSILPYIDKNDWFKGQLQEKYKEEYRLLDEMNELRKSASPIVLALAQSMQTKLRAEQEAAMLETMLNNEFGLTKDEIRESFSKALGTADEILKDVLTSMQTMENTHGCKPITHNNIRRNRRR